MGMFSSDDGDWAPLHISEETIEAFKRVVPNIKEMKKIGRRIL